MTVHTGFQPLIELDVGGTGRVGLSAAGLSAIFTDAAIAGASADEAMFRIAFRERECERR
jgi:hypothetical protein